MAKPKRTRTADYIDLTDISPMTENQSLAFASKKNLVLCGSAGSGKSFIACYFALKAIEKRQNDKIVIMRSAVPTRDIGFLPGTDKEKVKIYEEPYINILAELLNRGDGYDILKTKGILHFMTTSYLRGITLTDATILIDECQNMTLHELDSIITRVGENCRVIFCGDFKQSDLPSKQSGMLEFLRILRAMNTDFDIIEFTLQDVVRSAFVKRYLETKEYLNL